MRPNDDQILTKELPFADQPTTNGSLANGISAPSDMPACAQTLAQLIANAKQVKLDKSALLEPHRDVLLEERHAGTSISVLTNSLNQLGVPVSKETLRLWFLKNHMPKRRLRRRQPAASTPKQSGTSLVTMARPAAPAVSGFSTGVTAGRPTVPFMQKRGPKIARDDF